MTTQHRHSRQDWDEAYQLITWWKPEVLHNAKVLVIGAGALGNEVLKNLALLNVGNIVIVDFDRIEYSNLSRSVLFRESDCLDNRLKVEVAAERVKEINPNVQIQTINGDVTIDLGLGLLRRMDVVIGCLDNRFARLMLNRMCHKVNKVWIDGGIENLSGQLSVFKPNTSCYECQLPNKAMEQIRYRMGCADIAKRNANFGRIATTPISASIIAALQVQEALKILVGKDESTADFLYIDGMNNLFIPSKFGESKEDCLSHYYYDSIEETPELSHQDSLKKVFQFLEDKYNSTDILIELEHNVITEITSKLSGKTFDVFVPKPHFSEKEQEKYREHEGDDLVFTQVISEIDHTFKNSDKSLKAFGIPSLHIMSVLIDNQRYFIELTGDDSLT